MLYGESGTGKSTFAATYSDAARVVGKPILVVGMDPPSKMSPYRDVGYDCVRVGEDDPLGLYQWYLDNGVLAEDVVDRDGNMLIRIECYLDPDPDNPVAANVLEARFAAFGLSASDWSSSPESPHTNRSRSAQTPQTSPLAHWPPQGCRGLGRGSTRYE